MAEVAKTCAAIRFFGDDLNPDELSTMLGTRPSSAARKDDPMRSGWPSRHGKWILDTDEQAGDQLDHQIGSLLGRMTSNPEVWRDLTSRFRADAFCGVWMKEEDQGMELSASVLKKLGDRGLKLDLCLYVVAQDAQPVTK